MQLQGKRQRQSLGHGDSRKADKQKKQLEKELRMGYVEPGSMPLKQFIANSLERTGKQIRLSTRNKYRSIMEQFIEIVGNIDYQSVKLLHGERFIQHYIDRGMPLVRSAKKCER
jgi:hypothetical protein